MVATSDDAGTREAVLDLIVEKGPVTAVVLAKILRLTAAAVRRHITALEAEGSIAVRELPTSSSRGRGRPASVGRRLRDQCVYAAVLRAGDRPLRAFPSAG